MYNRKLFIQNTTIFVLFNYTGISARTSRVAPAYKYKNDE